MAGRERRAEFRGSLRRRGGRAVDLGAEPAIGRDGVRPRAGVQDGVVGELDPVDDAGGVEDVDVAARLGISEAALKSRIHRCRTTCREAAKAPVRPMRLVLDQASS